MKANIILTTAVAITLVACSGSSMASKLIPAEDGVHVKGYDLSEFGITPANWINFENDVKVKVVERGKNGSKGTLLMVTGEKGSGNYFNLDPANNYSIKGGTYKMKAHLDADGNLLKGDVKITGIINTEEGKANGKLLTAKLGDLLNDNDYAFTDSLLGFNTYNVKCHALIESINPEGCAGGESAYVSLDKALGDFTKKFKSTGLAVTGAVGVSALPVPAAAWLFGSGLLGLIGMARRRKQ